VCGVASSALPQREGVAARVVADGSSGAVHRVEQVQEVDGVGEGRAGVRDGVVGVARGPRLADSVEHSVIRN
jgi:hypothetical protein